MPILPSSLPVIVIIARNLDNRVLLIVNQEGLAAHSFQVSYKTLLTQFLRQSVDGAWIAFVRF